MGPCVPCLPACLPARAQYTYSLFHSTSGMLACGYGVSQPVLIEELWMMLVLEFAGSMLQLVFQVRRNGLCTEHSD